MNFMLKKGYTALWNETPFNYKWNYSVKGNLHSMSPLCVLIWAWNNQWRKNSSLLQCQSSLWLFSSLFFFHGYCSHPKGPAPRKNAAFPSLLQHSHPNPHKKGQAMKYVLWTESPRSYIYTVGRQPEFKDNTLWVFKVHTGALHSQKSTDITTPLSKHLL